MYYDKVFQFLSARKRYKKINFRMWVHNLALLSDKKPSIFTNVTKGRESLARKIIELCSIRDIDRLLIKFKDEPNPQLFLTELGKTVTMSEQDAQNTVNCFKSHYGQDTFNLLKNLLIIKHINARKLIALGKEPFIEFNNSVILLTRASDQAKVYSYFMNKFPDPLGLRLALAPQYHFAYENCELSEMISKIRWHYNDFTKPERCKVDRKLFVHNSPIYEIVYKIIMKYTSDMINKGIYAPILSSLVDNKTGRLAYGNFTYDAVKEQMKKFDNTKILECLQYGILPDPWRFLNDVVLFVINKKPNIGVKYKFVNDPSSLIQKYSLRKVWNAKQKSTSS